MPGKNISPSTLPSTCVHACSSLLKKNQVNRLKFSFGTCQVHWRSVNPLRLTLKFYKTHSRNKFGSRQSYEMAVTMTHLVIQLSGGHLRCNKHILSHRHADTGAGFSQQFKHLLRFVDRWHERTGLRTHSGSIDLFKKARVPPYYVSSL